MQNMFSLVSRLFKKLTWHRTLKNLEAIISNAKNCMISVLTSFVLQFIFSFPIKDNHSRHGKQSFKCETSEYNSVK